MAMAVVFLIVSLLAAPTVYAVDHVVGETSGWTQSVNYAAWASGKTFTVGDNLGKLDLSTILSISLKKSHIYQYFFIKRVLILLVAVQKDRMLLLSQFSCLVIITRLNSIQ